MTTMVLEISASEYVIYQNLIENAFPILMSFFLGSWTDANGRKPILTLSLFGYFVAFLIYTFFSLMPDLSPMYILLSSTAIAAGGGLTALLISGVSLMTRQVPIENRSLRLSILSVCFDAGGSIGYFTGEKVYKLLGYTHVFGLTAILYGCAVLCAIFLISEDKPESRIVQSGNCSSRCREFFDVGSVKETVVTCFKKRQHKRRRWILILSVSVVVAYLSYSVRSYLYLYTRNKFGWDLADYSNFSIATCILNNVGGLTMAVIAIKLFHVEDIYLGLLSVTSNLAGYLVMIFATSGWLIYLASGVQMLGAVTTAVMRSILSKCVDPEEHGKLFSFVTCAELAMPFVAGPLYGLIYMNTAATFPAALFLVPITIQALLILSYLYLHHLTLNQSPFSALREE